MAIVTGGLQRLLFNYPNLDISKLKLVGWGAGQYFKAYYPFLKDKLALEYTVCPATGDEYGSVLGVDVRPPSALLDECPENTIVVIFAGQFFDVMHLLRDGFNGLRGVRAFEAMSTLDGGDVALLSELQDFWRIKPTLSLQCERTHTPDFGIFVQGLASSHTPHVLAWNRLRYPGAYQCMVTWDNQPREILDECRRWLDRLILVPQPEHTGYLFLNAILRSCRLGVEHLAEQGIEYAVRCRSDNILSGSIHQVLEKYFSRGRNQGKIATAAVGGWWHHLPFMFTEKVMVSRTRDMLELWSMPEDLRPHDHPDFSIPKDSHFLELQKAVPEVMLWSSYAARLGFPIQTLEDSHDFMQSNLLPLEPYLSSVSLKFLPLFNVFANREFTSSLSMWHESIASPEDTRAQARAISQLDMTVRDFFEHKIG